MTTPNGGLSTGGPSLHSPFPKVEVGQESSKQGVNPAVTWNLEGMDLQVELRARDLLQIPRAKGDLRGLQGVPSK